MRKGQKKVWKTMDPLGHETEHMHHEAGIQGIDCSSRPGHQALAGSESHPPDVEHIKDLAVRHLGDPE